ncbi:MAG: hypothetical protein P4L31_07180 [Candidatus Babeliales bacterium]|nr:hypothetical protein [Candidatus Babeliales bacterium]
MVEEEKFDFSECLFFIFSKMNSINMGSDDFFNSNNGNNYERCGSSHDSPVPYLHDGVYPEKLKVIDVNKIQYSCGCSKVSDGYSFCGYHSYKQITNGRNNLKFTYEELIEEIEKEVSRNESELFNKMTITIEKGFYIFTMLDLKLKIYYMLKMIL